MFSKLLVIATVAAVAFAQHHHPKGANESISIDQYANNDCSGATTHHYDVPVGHCVAGNGDHNVSSVKFRCLDKDSGDVCATIADKAGANCSDLSHAKSLPCGQCMRMGRMGFHQLACNASAGQVTMQIECDEGCTTCNKTKTLKVGQCESHRDESMELTAVGPCEPTVFEATFSEAECKGDKHHYVWKSGACEYGWKFTCEKGVAPPSPSMLPKIQRGH